MKTYRIPWGASTVMLVTLFLGTFTQAVVDAVGSGEYNVTALLVAGASAIAASISRTFQFYVASKDPEITPELDEV